MSAAELIVSADLAMAGAKAAVRDGVAMSAPDRAELLLRPREGDKVIAPAAFLGAAEELGLIHAIGRWVLAQGHHFGKPSPPVPGLPRLVGI